MTMDRKMRTGDVAKALGLAPATVQGYARQGLIPAAHTPGGQYRFNLAEVQAVLQPKRMPDEVLPSLVDDGRASASLTPLADMDDRSRAWLVLRGHPESPVAPIAASAAELTLENLTANSGAAFAVLAR